MTAEVAIVNRSAVALATDSYATVSDAEGNPRKTYVVNKLFTLSKHHPVGVMVYGNSEMLQVPWETTIKMYRRSLSERTFASIHEYAKDFIEYIQNSRALFPQEAQDAYFVGVVRGMFIRLDKTTDNSVKARVGAEGTVSEDEIKQAFLAAIADWESDVDACENRENLADDFRDRLSNRYSARIDEILEAELGKKPISEEGRATLRDCAIDAFTRKYHLGTSSGLVFAGFGEGEVFPSVESYLISGVVEDSAILEYQEASSHKGGNGSAVLPFAQRDVVHSFLLGMNLDDLYLVDKFVSSLFDQIPSIIADELCSDDAEKQRVVERVRTAMHGSVHNFGDDLFRILRQKYAAPLLDVVEHLPKEELADLAEALVSVTSVRRKVSRDIETVGGPIDLAVISKGDGFVWLKRKHYFDPDLNQPFLQRYFER